MISTKLTPVGILLLFAILYITGCKKCNNAEDLNGNAKLDQIEKIMFQQPELLDSLLGRIDTINITPFEQARISTVKGLIYINKQHYDQCIKELEKAEHYFIENNIYYHLHLNKLIRAFAFEHLKLESQATTLYLACEEYFNKTKNHKVQFYASLGLLRLSDYLKLDRAVLFDGLKNTAEQLDKQQYLGLLYSAMGNLEKNDSLRIIYYEQAVSSFIDNKRFANAYTIETNILFAKIKQDPSGITQDLYNNFTKKPYDYFPNDHQVIRYEYAWAYLLAKIGKNKESISVANNVYTKATRANYEKVKTDCTQLMAHLYKKMKDYEMSHKMLERYNALRQTQISEMQRNQMLALGAHYRYTELERQKLKLKLKAQRSWILLGGVSVILFLFVLTISFQLRKSKYKQKILKLKNIAVEEQIGNLIGSLKKEKNKNNKLIGQVEAFKIEYSDTKDISEFLDAIDKNQINTWMEYEACFTKLRPDWIHKLKTQVPKLTATDLKYCMCLYFNLNNYTISKLCFVSDDAVKSAKKRIRDKLSLNDSKEIYATLKNIG